MGKATSTWNYGKKTLKQLPGLKILIVKESGGNGYILLCILIADLQCLKDVFCCSAFGGEVLNVSVNWGGRNNGGSGRKQDFSDFDLLGMTVSLGPSLGLSRSTFICTMSLFVTLETESLSDATSSVSREELFQVDEIHFHGIRVFGGV